MPQTVTYTFQDIEHALARETVTPEMMEQIVSELPRETQSHYRELIELAQREIVADGKPILNPHRLDDGTIHLRSPFRTSDDSRQSHTTLQNSGGMTVAEAINAIWVCLTTLRDGAHVYIILPNDYRRVIRRGESWFEIAP
jgi:hypothetical protein